MQSAVTHAGWQPQQQQLERAEPRTGARAVGGSVTPNGFKVAIRARAQCQHGHHREGRTKADHVEIQFINSPLIRIDAGVSRKDDGRRPACRAPLAHRSLLTSPPLHPLIPPASRPDGRCRVRQALRPSSAVEESPGSRDQRWRLTAAGGDPGKVPQRRDRRRGATRAGKGETVR